MNLPDDAFSIIVQFLPSHYAFSLTCKRFNDLMRKYVVPTDSQVIRVFQNNYPKRTMLRLIEDKRVNLGTHDSIVLNLAILIGDCDIVARLLKDDRIDPTADNNAPLLLACAYGDEQIVSILLKDKRINPNSRDCLIDAIWSGNYNVVKLLMNDSRIDPSINDNLPIRKATILGNKQIVSLLLSDSRVDPSACDNEALIHAIENNYVEIVGYLLKHPRIDPSKNRNKAVRVAAKHGAFESLVLLLKDSRVNAADKNNTAIIKASENNHYEIVSLLMKMKGVDPSAQNNLALRRACVYGNYNVIRILIKDPRIEPSIDVLFYLVKYNECKCIKAIISHPFFRKNAHEAIMILLYNNSNIEHIKALLPFSNCTDNVPYLLKAIERYNFVAFKYLLSLKNTQVTNEVIISAFKFGSYDIISLLVDLHLPKIRNMKTYKDDLICYALLYGFDDIATKIRENPLTWKMLNWFKKIKN